MIGPDKLMTDHIVDDPFWIRLGNDDRLVKIAQQFICPDIALFGAHYFNKMPFGGKAVLWHQDGSYWPLEPMEVVSLWLAVDRSVPENGLPEGHSPQPSAAFAGNDSNRLGPITLRSEGAGWPFVI